MDKCKAKDPYNCRFHSKHQYNNFVASQKYYQEAITKAENYTQYEEYKKAINHCQAKIDANKYGLKLLLKEFKTAQKVGNVKLQAELAHRIDKAAQERIKDGQVNKWVEVNTNLHLYGPRVLEEAETKDIVKVPYFLTGTQSLMFLYTHLMNNDCKIVDVDLEAQYTRDDTEFENPEHIQKLKQKLKEFEPAIKNNDLAYVWDNFFEKENTFIRGLTFKKDQRIIIVEGIPPKFGENNEWD